MDRTQTRQRVGAITTTTRRPAGGPRPPLDAAIGRLVSLGTRSDQVVELLSFLSSTLNRSAAVVDRRGLVLASAPAGTRGNGGLADALSKIEADVDGTASGWQILPLRWQHDLLGFLVLLADPAPEAGEHALVEVARSLLADQLRRASMTARLLDERRSALLRRLIGDRQLTAQELAAESERAQTTLADAYWPAIVSWEPGEVNAAVLSEIEDAVRRQARDHLAIRHDPRTVVLLVARGATGTDYEQRTRSLVEQVVALARTRPYGAHVRAIVARGSVPLTGVAARVEGLLRLSRYLEQRPAPIEGSVHSESAYGLLTLLEAVDRERVTAFVANEIGPLLSYDRAHGAHLTDVLEIALDVPNRADAAKAAYMHRNTFRRYLRRATELVDSDLDDPDERLAVHVALKLTDLLGIEHDRPLARAADDALTTDAVRSAPRGLTPRRARSDTQS